MKLKTGGDGFGGKVTIPRLITTKIRLRPNTNKRKDTSPDYWVETPEYDNQNQAWFWAASGAAWFKKPKAGGEEFFSINLDMADQPNEINFAGFLADEEDQPKKGEGGALYRLTYSRPRRSGSGGASAPANPAPVLKGDSIPY